MCRFKLFSPAKINLYLDVNHRRADGFHDITTLFHRIHLYDTIEMVVRPSSPGIHLKSSDLSLPTDFKNLAYQAAEAFFQYVRDESCGVFLNIEKRIPVAGGLGGGSSNAATVLLGLNQFMNYPLSIHDLCDIGSALGSDVNFFLHQVNWAWGYQRGEVVKPVKTDLNLNFLVVNPGFPILARDVYKSFKLDLTKKLTDDNILQQYLEINDSDGLTRCAGNNLEKAIFALCPQLCDVIERLRSIGTGTVIVSGSGPSVFAFSNQEHLVQEWHHQIQNTYPQSFVVKTADPQVFNMRYGG
jgi:4-diphosphocytidyl-2-C-methyl-D-erythritol kinase